MIYLANLKKWGGSSPLCPSLYAAPGAAYAILEPHGQINQAYNVPFQKIAKVKFINDDSSQIFLQKILLKKHFRCKKKDSLTCDEEEA